MACRAVQADVVIKGCQGPVRQGDPRRDAPGAANVWSVGVNAPLQAGVKKGDKLLIAFYAWVEKPKATTATIASAPAPVAAAPHIPSCSAKASPSGPKSEALTRSRAMPIATSAKRGESPRRCTSTPLWW